MIVSLAPLHERSVGVETTPSAEEIYRTVFAERTSLANRFPFESHLLACAFTISLLEARESGGTISSSIGLDRAALDELSQQWFPAARRLIPFDAEPETVILDEEELQLHEMLSRFLAEHSTLGGWLTSIVARRALAPRHLWQDLGLLNRSELTRLMELWFPALAAANVKNMKWKKFFYRKLCELEGFSLCAAPTCRECADFDDCFGDEDGVSALARISRI